MAQGFLEDHDVADVYLGNLENGHVEKITNGALDGSGFWNPVWSPDGKRIAMLSTRGGNVYLWTWDRNNGLRKVTNRAIDLGATIAWLSDDRILCQVLPAGQQPVAMSVELQTPRIAMHAWPIDWRGQKATANVLESGVTTDVSKRPQGQLLILDLSAGKEHIQVLAQAAHFNSLTLSRDRRYAAVFSEVGILEPRAGRKLQSDFDNGIYTLSIYDMRSGTVTARFDIRDVGGSPLSWSWDGKELAVLGEPATVAFKSPPSVFRCTIATHHCINILPAFLNMDASPNRAKVAPLWAADGRILWYADTLDAAKGPATKDRSDWYSFGRDGSALNVTGTLSSAPASLVTAKGGNYFIGLVNGKLTAVFADGRSARSLTITGLPQLTSIAWPMVRGDDQQYLVAIAAAADTRQDFYTVDLRSNRSLHVAHLSQDATLNAFAPKTLSAVFAESNRDGSFIRYAYQRGPVRMLFSANTWLAHIAEGRSVHFTYTSLDGEKLNGWVLLPINYQAGRRYPAVVWVYAGYLFNSKKPYSLAALNDVHALNLQFLAAHGYAVIFPSMPLPPFGHPTDPYRKLTDGVLPAVGKAVRLGYVDTNRVAVMGQSYGGFSTYGLITQTDRFKAAIALAGISDWASLYGTYDGRERYDDYVNENDEFNESLIEDGQGNLGDPPWVNPQRYARNSPITYVANVHTPLLIIQGDLDYVAMQQGEEFFTALYRQGKRAEFIRYWGEEHVFRSEANITDYWQRMNAWLDEFLR